MGILLKSIFSYSIWKHQFFSLIMTLIVNIARKKKKIWFLLNDIAFVPPKITLEVFLSGFVLKHLGLFFLY